MSKVIGVRFRQAGKIYYFSPGKLDIKEDDKIIVETMRGKELGTVVVAEKEMDDSLIQQPIKVIERIASDKDLLSERENKNREQDAIEICREKVRAHGLQMKIIQAEFTFDNSKVLFYFTADGRIDFRELVKDLASVFRTRIELRQIGVRDETKIRGGIGICGRELCCNKYLTDFSPVSIKMAKDQNISLNPTKISGVCGRLMCCLSNEEATYEELNGNLPAIGSRVETKDGQKGEVISVTILRQLVKVMFVNKEGQKEFKELNVGELIFKGTRKQQLNEQNQDIDENVAKILREDHIDSDKDKKNGRQRGNKFNGRQDRDNNGHNKREYKGNKPHRDLRESNSKGKVGQGAKQIHPRTESKPEFNENHKKTHANERKVSDKNFKGTNQTNRNVKELNQNSSNTKDRKQNERNLKDKNYNNRNTNNRNQKDAKTSKNMNDNRAESVK